MKTRRYQLSTIETDDFTLAGYSVAGEESVVIVPELDSVFDIGRCPHEALHVNHVLLSHGHADHSVGILYYFHQRAFQGIAGGKALVPRPLVKPLEQLMRAWGRVDGNLPEHTFVGVEGGDDFQIRRGLVARAFKTRHRGASLGYSLVEIRRKLLPELAGLSGPQIVERKKQGQEVTYRLEIPHVAYLGDTGKANYSDLPCVAEAKVLLLECTFFDPDHVSRARAGQHIHVLDLPEVLEGMNNERIVLCHVTRRTNMSQARRILKRSLPAKTLEKITFLMSRRYIEQE
jgi:ribonuclease Z